MKETLTVCAVVLGVLAALLQLLDWASTKEQKAAMTDKLLDTWIWLDKQSSGQFIPAVWTLRAQLILVGIYVIPLAIILLMWGVYNAASHPGSGLSGMDILSVVVAFVCVLALGAAFFLLHRRIMKKANTVPGVKKYFRFVFGQAMLYSLSFLALLLVRNFMLAFQSRVLTLILVLAVLPFYFEALILWTVISLSIAWIVVAWLLAKTIRSTSFLLERALSQEKGVLAGCAALCLVIAALLKFSTP
jgi:hypothetical protein